MSGQVLAIALIAAVAAGCLVRASAADPGPSRSAPCPVHRPGPGPARHHRAAAGGRLDVGVGSDGDGGRQPSGRRVGRRHHRRARAAAAPRRPDRRHAPPATADGSSATRVFGFVFGVAMALLLGLSTTAALIVAVAFGGGRGVAVAGQGRRADRRPAHPDACRGPHVCQMLAVWLRTGDTPSGALDRLTQRAVGHRAR